MTQYTKPTVLPQWGETAGGADVLQPSNAEIQAGWPLTSVPPSRKRFNWILKYLAQGVRYLMQNGIPLWDAAEDYPVNARVMGSNGKTYKALQTSINQDPTTATAYWQLWGTDGRDDQLQLTTAFTTAGTAPNFTLAVTPAPSALAANLRLRIKFHVAGAGSDALNVSALGNKSLKQYDSTGAKVDAVIAENQLADVEYDGVDMVIMDPLPPTVSVKQIQTITASVAANALTVGLNPANLDFRSNSLTSGAVNTRTIAAALSLTVPTGATLGTISGQRARLALLAIDNAGTVELAVANLSGGVNLDETTLISTTAINAAATSASVIYSTTARSNVPFRVVGFVDITEAAAGTWETAPTTIQGQGGQALAALQSVGYGQTWQSVGGSRAMSTTYYNTTGRPIAVAVMATTNTATTAGVSLIINGVNFGGDYCSMGVTGAKGSTVFGIVPPGGSYSVSPTGSTSISYWNELR